MNRTISYFKSAVYTFFAIIVFTPSSHALTVATWNIEWLTINGQSRYPQSLRTQQDYLALQSQFEQLAPDVLAFQEVDSIEALRKVVGNGYQVFLSERANPNHHSKQFKDINQYTGFAIKNSYNVTNKPDLVFSPNSKLRFATHISLHHNEQWIELLSVHLKAGCSGRYNPNNRSCRQLKQQAKVLNEWLTQRELAGQDYIVLGDFNHNLAFKGDWLWTEIKRGLSNPPSLATGVTQAKCKVRSRNNPNKTHQFRSLIDHILVSTGIDTHTAQQWVYPSDQVLRYRLSDHCPVYVDVVP